jgi:prepilin-type processing-associated H-X9-DG protein
VQHRSRRRAVTRLEVIVIAGLGVFCVAVTFLLLVRQRENGLRAQCMNNLRRMGDAMLTYADSRNTPFLPPARIADGYATWAVLTAPHLTLDHPLTKWDMSRTYFAQPADVREALMPYYICPARSRTARLSVSGDIDPATGQHVAGAIGDYAGVAGTGAADHPWDGPDADGAIILGEVLERRGANLLRWHGRVTLAAIQEARGLASTMLIGEKHVPSDRHGEADAGDGSLYDGGSPASCTRVAGPGHPLAASEADPFNLDFGSAHPGVCQFLFADGSVRAFANHVNVTVLAQMARRGK